MFDIPVVDDEPTKQTRKRTGIMLCYPFEEKRLATWTSPYLIQPKLDGVRCRAVINDDQVLLVSSENNIISLVPHINEALLKAFKGINIELDGELYCHGMKFEEIVSITSRSVNIHKKSEMIEYHIFDVISNDAQITRIANLNKLTYHLNNPVIKIVEPQFVRDIGEIMEFYSTVIDKGYEGFVIRNTLSQYQRKRSTDIMKFKPHQWDTYTVLGMQEEISITGNPKGTLGAFVCGSTEGTVFNVGTGLTAEQRVVFWKNKADLIGKKIKVKYQAMTTGKGVPRFPVFLDVVK